MTPRAFQALMDRVTDREEARQHERLSLVALETAYLANLLAPKEKGKPWEVEDFMPKLKRERRTRPPSGNAPHTPKPKQSVDHMKSLLKGLTAAYGGEIRERKPDSEEAAHGD